MNEISQTIRYLRKQSGLTQSQLAQLAGVGKTVIFDIEKGKATIQLNSLLNVLNALNTQLRLDTPLPIPLERKQ